MRRGSENVLNLSFSLYYGGLSFLTHCNYDVNSLQMNHLPSFYREVLKQWQSTKQAFQNDTSPHDEIIWNNRDIKIEGKTRFYKDWFEKNILRIEDLLQNDGNFLSFNQFSEKFHLETPFTLYFGLINSIPTKWKLAMKRTPRQKSENDNKKKHYLYQKRILRYNKKHFFTPHG